MMPEHKNQEPDGQKKKAGREEQARSGQASPQQQEQPPAAQQTAAPQRGVQQQPSQFVADSERGSRGERGPVGPRKRRYLVAQRPIPPGMHMMVAGGLQPMSSQQIEDELRSLGANIVKEIKPRAPSLSMFGTEAGRAAVTTPSIVVAELEPEKGEQLRMAVAANMIVEHDALLKHLDVGVSATLVRSAVEASVSPLAPTTSTQLSVRVCGPDGEPVGRATVCLYGRGFPAQGTTDDNGAATISMMGGGPDSIQAIYVKPAADYWERFIVRPALNEGDDNTILLRRLDETYPEFETKGMVGWGQKLMGVDQLAKSLTGRGVKIAIIDSGCDNSHPQLQHVRQGVDLTTEGGNSDTWTQDTISHGTHCAGIIGAGSGPNAAGIRGFAPEAEIHAFKVFPGGRFSALIEALDLCIERGIDVVNLSLGSDEVSELVTQKILEAQSKGVACIVAAGNSGGPVQFPGNLPGVLTVSAIGKTGEYPEDSYHAQTLDPSLPINNGIFPAKFSCFGPGIDVCAPGVAILSCVAGGGYAAWDGTSMATPHVTGLAALLLAHHPLFQGPLKARSAERVAALFQLIKSSAVPLVADIQRGGAGLPTVQALLGLATAAPAPTMQPPQTRPGEGAEGHRQPGMIDNMPGYAAGQPGRTGYGTGISMSAGIGAAAGLGPQPGIYFSGVPAVGYMPWPQQPAYGAAIGVQDPLTNLALTNPAAFRLISQMRAAGLL